MTKIYLDPGPPAPVSSAAFRAGVSSGTTRAARHAAWEHREQVKRRTKAWQEAITKVDGSHQHVWSSRDCLGGVTLRDVDEWTREVWSYRLIDRWSAMVERELLHPLLDTIYHLIARETAAEFNERTGEITWPQEDPPSPSIKRSP